ncbi:hypothetical protein ALC62_11190 [Cyphomyrmex costatus]|uniref:Uncharacterized protein n=1 Tax=Cyphomyrmex costatus TaxID=456900 RepID=A0A151ICS0_9HYME|nr:hypothetical protein ALC62_11190 [Cyphomyrmex costatus]
MSELDSSDMEKQKRNRRNRAKKFIDSSDDDDELHSTLPRPPKKPISSMLPSQLSTSSIHSYQKKLQSTKAVSKQKCNETTLISKENRNQVKETSFSSSFNNKIFLDVCTKKSVPEPNLTMAMNAEFQKEIFRRFNKIEFKLDRIDERKQIFEEKVDKGITEKNVYINIDDLVSLPLQMVDDMTTLEANLQDANFFYNIVISL